MHHFLKSRGVSSHLITAREAIDDEITIEEGILKKLEPILRVFPPDPSLFWSIKVAIYLSKKHASQPFGFLTTLPPNGLGIIGILIKKLIPNSYWVLDWRDLWTKHPLYKPPFTKKFLDPMLEKKYMNKADLVIFNTAWDLEFNQQLFPNTKNKSLFIRNGFDKILTNQAIDEFRFIYTGGTTAGQATVKVSMLMQQLNDHGIEASCDFYGEYDKGMDNAPHIKYYGKIAPENVPSLLTNYKYGLIYLPKGSENGGRVAQKFYDYIGSGVIPICFRASLEMKMLMNTLNTGFTIEDNMDFASIHTKLLAANFSANREQQEQLTRNRQFEKLYSYLMTT